MSDSSDLRTVHDDLCFSETAGYDVIFGTVEHGLVALNHCRSIIPSCQVFQQRYLVGRSSGACSGTEVPPPCDSGARAGARGRSGTPSDAWNLTLLTRAWSPSDTMVPVEPSIANQLEAGYRELRAFSQEWQEELRCAVEVGPLGEEKVSFPLWPETTTPVEARKQSQRESIASDPFCAARCFRGEAAAEGTLEPVKARQDESTGNPAQGRSYQSHHVLYRNERAAFLLKPSLKPSAYYGRRPLQKIMRGLTVGVPVIRGFDRDSWSELHEKKKQARKGEPRKSVETEASGPGNCPGCKAEEARGQVTDLVLVAHGIGQKFAERVESFHFTHAITAFRRSINIELRNPEVKSVLREEHRGIMVLPVNWRHHLSFEDGGPMTDADKATSASDNFGLKDIEPNTIPAVRSLISDVMFDIPFYMSHHKPKMISALVTEANRVYRLWCRNNPVFSHKGRVHLIAHSLGSVMVMFTLLSRSPSALSSFQRARGAFAMSRRIHSPNAPPVR